MTRLKRLLLALPLLLAATLAGAQQDYPNKPIRFIIAFAPGGGTDILARLVATHLSRTIGQPVLAENRAGASGIIAAEYVAKSAPDGYTLLFGGSSPMVFNPIVFDKLPYDPNADLAPITLVGSYPLVITAKNDLPVKTVADLIKLAKEAKAPLTYGSAGVAFQVPTEYFATRAGIKLQVVPYKGSGPATTALMAGDIDLLVVDMAPAVGLLKSGKARAIAVTTAKRNPVIPDVPTIAEAGLADFDVSLFSSLSAPGKTPPEIVRKIQQEVAKVLALPEVKERMTQLGVEAGGMSPEATGQRFQREINLYRPIARAAGVRETQ